MKTTVEPTSDRLLVKKLDNANKTKGGLMLPDDAKERPTKGEVLESGQGRMNDDGVVLPMKVKKGDIILYPQYSGYPVKVDGEDLLILDEKEVLAILKENN
jgi:chaperonin GroES